MKPEHGRSPSHPKSGTLIGSSGILWHVRELSHPLLGKRNTGEVDAKLFRLSKAIPDFAATPGSCLFTNAFFGGIPNECETRDQGDADPCSDEALALGCSTPAIEQTAHHDSGPEKLPKARS
jgi:hypothetical protein